VKPRQIAFGTAMVGIFALGVAYEMLKTRTGPLFWLLAIGPFLYGLYWMAVLLGRRFGRRAEEDSE
jgi:hypothetical protein